MSLKSVKNEALVTQLKTLVQEERKLTLEILHYLREVESRRIFSELAYSSLHEFCVKELGYSSAASYRRIESMRLLKTCPEVEEKIQEGTLNLTVVSTVQSFIKSEKKQTGKTYTPEETVQLLESVSGKTTREVEKVLMSLSPQSVPFKQEKERMISPTQTEIKFIADDELMSLLERVRDLQGGSNAYPSYSELFKLLAREYLKKKDPRANAPAPEKRDSKEQSPVPRKSRYIPRSVLRGLYLKSGGQCEYVSPKTGRRCSATRALQFEHVQGFAKGGETTLKNAQHYCFHHNQLKAIQDYGWEKMRLYLASAQSSSNATSPIAP